MRILRHVIPDDSKFGFIWMSHLTHDNPSNIFHADDYVREFFGRTSRR